MKKMFVTLSLIIALLGTTCLPLMTAQAQTCTHDWSDWVVEEEATCTTTGTQTRTCSQCGAEQTQTIAATGHTWGEWDVDEDPTCTEAGSEYRWCENCDAEQTRTVAVTGHNWGKWKTKKKATTMQAGKKVRECKYCDATQKKKIAKKKMTASMKKAKKVANDYMKAAKAYDVNKMNSLFANKKCSTGYPTSVVDGYLKKYNKKYLKWKFVDVKKDGKIYKVKMKVTRPDMYNNFYKAVDDTLTWYLGMSLFYSEPSKSALFQKYNANLVKYLKKFAKKSKKTDTTTITLKIKKTKKGWKIVKKTKAIVDIACGYANAGMDAAYDEWD
ncbi:hypothetical protein [Eubacterium oxidoreducens]|uniref:Uncharacterized protein n=1 Tax=Eubacterium oxidoreducens TaxID=1732 RepID=A0A1G6A3E2_EUBOX|nr:hypothetical protein [Eubacterium oxidoreducens]SDB02957.1 hypothetical protein SAMN02910417_00217 [Eubacterium oxidoreducens]